MEIDDAWRILGVDEQTPADAVRSAFRSGVRERHPDLHGGGRRAHSETRDLIAAYRLALAFAESRTVAVRADAHDVAVSEDHVSTARRIDDETGPAPAPRRAERPVFRESGAPEVLLVGSDTIALGCPADEAYPLLVDVAHRIGDVTHVDRSSFEFLEFLVRSTSGDTLSVVCSLQGRSNGFTEVFFTIEPLETAKGPVPDVAEIVDLFIARLAG